MGSGGTPPGWDTRGTMITGRAMSSHYRARALWSVQCTDEGSDHPRNSSSRKHGGAKEGQHRGQHRGGGLQGGDVGRNPFPEAVRPGGGRGRGWALGPRVEAPRPQGGGGGLRGPPQPRHPMLVRTQSRPPKVPFSGAQHRTATADRTRTHPHTDPAGPPHACAQLKPQAAPPPRKATSGALPAPSGSAPDKRRRAPHALLFRRAFQDGGHAGGARAALGRGGCDPPGFPRGMGEGRLCGRTGAPGWAFSVRMGHRALGWRGEAAVSRRPAGWRPGAEVGTRWARGRL